MATGAPPRRGKEGHAEGVLAAVRKAEAAVYRARGDRQKVAAESAEQGIQGAQPARRALNS
jgi:hypothetical protein